MCRQLTLLARNEYQQMVMICEHDTIHLVHQHTSIRLKRDAFFQLDQMLQSRCLTNSNGPLRCKTSHDGSIELWIGGGGFRMLPAELIALAKLVQDTADCLRTTPLDELLDKNVERLGFWQPPVTTSPSLN